MRRISLLVSLLLLVLGITPSSAQNQPRQAIPVRCVNIAGTAFEACGGGGGGGGGAVTTDPDDGSIAAAQTNDNGNALNNMYNGAVWIRMSGDATNGLDVDVTRLPALPAGTNVIGHVIVDSGGGGGTQFAEDTASQNGDIGSIALVRRTLTPANTSGADGDLEYLQINAGRLWTSATIDAALPTGTNVIGHVINDAGSAVIGHVIVDTTSTSTVTQATGTNLHTVIDSGSITCGNCSGTGVAVNEDVASANADPGTPSYAVRKATPGNTSSADGDYEALQINAGRLWTSSTIDAALPTGSNVIGHVIVDSGGGGGTQFAEDVASAGADVGTVANVVRSDTLGSTTSATGDYTPMKSTSTGALWISPADSAGTAITDTTAHAIKVLFVDPSGTAGTLASDVTEDAASASDPTGPQLMIRRRDTPVSNEVSAEGDNIAVNGDAYGAIYVNCRANCSGGTQYAEDAVAASGDTGTLILAVRRNTAVNSTSADGDNEALELDANGKLWTNAELTVALPSGSNTIGAVNIAAAQTLATVTAVTTVSTVTSLSQLGGVALPIEDAAETAAGVGIYAMSVRRDTPASSAGTAGDNATLNTDANGYQWTRNADPCTALPKVYVPFSISSATTTQLVAASASNFNYICSINVVASAAENVALIEDDTAACASPTAGMAGGVTAATGWNLAANGGLAHGDGVATVFKSAASNRYSCLITSSTAQLSGTISYVQAP